VSDYHSTQSDNILGDKKEALAMSYLVLKLLMLMVKIFLAQHCCDTFLMADGLDYKSFDESSTTKILVLLNIICLTGHAQKILLLTQNGDGPVE
jgi:hypothetical protein